MGVDFLDENFGFLRQVNSLLWARRQWFDKTAHLVDSKELHLIKGRKSEFLLWPVRKDKEGIKEITPPGCYLSVGGSFEALGEARIERI